MTDLFPPRQSNGPGRVVKTYSYVDETGVELYQAVRFEPKGFRQRSKQPDGTWSWSISGCRRVLYQLPQVLEAVSAGDTVYICEGEKDVHSLMGLGVVATCNPMGAGKWHSDYTASLRGCARVVIVADKDEPGRKHAAQVARALASEVGEVLVLELPGEGVKDASDWIALGGTLDELMYLAEQAEPRSEPAAEPAPPAPTNPLEALGSISRYKEDYNDKVIKALMLPIINREFCLLHRDDTTERIYRVNARNEAVPNLTDVGVEKFVYWALDHYTTAGVPPHHNVRRTVQVWGALGRRITEEPDVFLFSDAPKDRLCIKRLDWKPEPGPIPAWHEFLDRLSDRKAFAAFVWSCFEGRNRSRQYLWLHDDGQGGKSVVLGVFADLFGEAAHGIDNSSMKETRFMNSAIWGKRLILYPDCKNPRFGMTELVRNWTSGDPVQVEFKGEKAFKARLRCKLMIASNYKPQITSQQADTSRLLYIKVGKSDTIDDPLWGDRLTEQLPAFLYYCKEVYAELVPNHGNIPLSSESLGHRQELTEDFEERFEVILERCFYLDPSARASAGDFRARLMAEGLHDNDIGDFKSWLERTKNVRQQRGADGRCYHGIGVRSV